MFFPRSSKIFCVVWLNALEQVTQLAEREVVGLAKLSNLILTPVGERKLLIHYHVLRIDRIGARDAAFGFLLNKRLMLASHFAKRAGVLLQNLREGRLVVLGLGRRVRCLRNRRSACRR
jgi:hypothetical protein